MDYIGQERRKNPRINARFIVSYRVTEEKDAVDISQTKNVCLGGMLLTTNRLFKPGIGLSLTLRVPFDPHPINIKAVVIDSKEIVKNLIYDTRLSFTEIDEKHKNSLTETVNHYLKK